MVYVTIPQMEEMRMNTQKNTDYQELITQAREIDKILAEKRKANKKRFLRKPTANELAQEFSMKL